MSFPFGLGTTVKSAVAGAFAPVNAEAIALIARMTTPPSNARKQLIDSLFTSLKTGATSATNILAKMDFLWVLAAADSQASLLDWTTAHRDLTANLAPTFTADRGWNGDGTTVGMCLASTFDISTSTKYTQNTCHLGAYALTAGTNGLESGGASSSCKVRAHSTGSAGLALLNVTGLNGCTAPAGFAPHHICGSRDASASHIAYRNGVAGVTKTTVAAAVASGIVNVLANANTAVATEGQVAIFHGGEVLNAAEALDLYNAFHTYLVGIGSPA